MASNIHLIQKQYLNVELNGTESDGLALQRRLPDLLQHRLLPAIEHVLERFSLQEGHVFIERLEIDAGALTLEQLEDKLAESVVQELEKSLRVHTSPEELSAMAMSGKTRHKTGQQSINEALIYFLKTGSLPWSFRLPDGATLEQVILGSWQESEKSGVDPLSGRDEMLRTLAGVTVRKRLVRQFFPALLEALFSLLVPEGKTVMDGFLQPIRSSAMPSVDKKYFELLLWETAFAKLAEGRTLTSMELVGEAWCAMPVSATGYVELERVLELHWADVKNRIPRRLSGLNKTSITDGHSGAGEKICFEPVSENLPGSANKPIMRSTHPDIEEGLYIENAGLVLLHPFLPRFFTGLGIAEEDKLLQPGRALCLLHFLATGQVIAPEHELILPKILCNVPLETPVESDVAVTLAEQEEAAALLAAVISHWDALRNTSADGLRGTFLLRPGKVSLREADWQLMVESRGFDVLLDQLPWGISMIKLPWMERMLWVKWK
ncbi:MAG: contractile injection system tape measure protein [Candidatus Scalindua sp.]|nr:contractile injection system tape measure protein [Candidatus Scalindua sp.]